MHCLALHDEVFGNRVVVVLPQRACIVADVAALESALNTITVFVIDLLDGHQSNASQNSH